MKLLVIIKENNLECSTRLRRIWRDYHLLFFGISRDDLARHIEKEKAGSLHFDGNPGLDQLFGDYLLMTDETEMFKFVKDTFNFDFLLWTSCRYSVDFARHFDPSRIIKIKNTGSYLIPYHLVDTPLDQHTVVDISPVIKFNGARVVSLGGWCGPAVAIRKIHFQAKTESYPFDWGHVSVEAVIRFIRNDFAGYLPEGPPCARNDIDWRYKEKAVSLQVACRKCFTNADKDMFFVHSDMNEEKERNKWRNRCRRFMDLIRGDYVVFIRTVTHADYREELSQIELLKETLDQLFPQLRYRFVLIFHDQYIGTTQLEPIDEQTMVWAVDGVVSWDDDCQEHLYHNYRRIIEFSLEEENWPPKADINGHRLVDHRQHWYI